MIITRAPLRLALGGGGTDLPFYSSKFGGSLSLATINKYNYIVVEKRDFYEDFLIRYSKTERVKKVEDIQHTRIKAALQYLEITDPLGITSFADVPSGTGLGSSSAFLVALLKALHAYKREEVSSKRLAEEAAHIEIEILKEPIGKQDQYAASYGGILHLEIDKNGNVIPSPVSIANMVAEELDNNLLLFSTNIARSASAVLEKQKQSAESDEEKMKHMHMIKDIGLEIKKSFEDGDVNKFGKWLNVHWETKKRFGSMMSSTEIDDYYELGLKHGAKGGKLVGAGGGGFLMFYCENNKIQLREAMKNEGLRELPFRFDFDGCKILYNAR